MSFTPKPMKTIIPVLLFLTVPVLLSGQVSDEEIAAHFPKHYISVNPLNILLFQQAGLTYEYKPGAIGYGITAGYIYPNHDMIITEENTGFKSDPLHSVNPPRREELHQNQVTINFTLNIGAAF